MGVAEDPEPLVLGLTGERVPPLVEVRRWTATALAELGDDHLQAVLLVSTELLTNAYEHAAGPFEVRLSHHRSRPCKVQVEVDDSSAEQPVLDRSRPGDTCGRGLIMVDELSEQWGVRPLPGAGKTVWATISCNGEGWIPCTGTAAAAGADRP
ncbi:ATP-binding protein [Lentzea flaviverrucosa]|uniref:Histidine kinase-like ATPase domain-containing protein n=1 Tax=Lentzea flaviverrucosa TaxID=200379 RepID=A0A1H9XW41_9PSEU|nr:ATP-binding protein [Lentzea flaviverrucosa]RDI34427.1 histidine kinase-like protein [Lentzea flaviverrucosa]SES50402.1 Histidine kinase-like ATPase domain-containing protein [Lentzea flaviverrucosa]